MDFPEGNQDSDPGSGNHGNLGDDSRSDNTIRLQELGPDGAVDIYTSSRSNTPDIPTPGPVTGSPRIGLFGGSTYPLSITSGTGRSHRQSGTLSNRPQTRDNINIGTHDQQRGQDRQDRTPIYLVHRDIVAPSFPIVDLDRKFAADLLSVYVKRGSMLTGVDVNLLNVTVTRLPTTADHLNVHWLCQHGMPIFDSIIWIIADTRIRPPLRLKPNAATFPILAPGAIAKALFFCYFYLLTQARYPGQLRNNETVPSFLRTVAGLTETPQMYMQQLCSFNPVLFDARWIKDITFQGFGQEVLSRFGLGVAGYRMFAPFKILQARPEMDRRALPALTYARLVASSPPTWSVHPITRAPALLTERGNLNKNLANLMLHCFPPDALAELVRTKQLYAMPVRQPGHDNWTQWTADGGMALVDPIFQNGTYA